LQPRNPASAVHFYSWFLQSVVDGEIDPQLTFFSDEVWSHLQGYINTQNNHYQNSQNPHLTHDVQLDPGKVGVWCAVSARRIVGLVLFYKRVNHERYAQVILGQFFPELTEEERLYGRFQQDSPTAHTAHISMQALLDSFKGHNYQQWYFASTFTQS
jgi:hypothetical protein